MSPQSITAVGLLALALVGCGKSADGGDPTTSNSEASRLFLAGTGEMWVVDVDAERAEHLRIPELGAGTPPHLTAAIGDRLALWDYDVTSVPMADPSSPPKTLAKNGWIFIPAADPDRIWVGFLDPGERALAELRQIDAEGNVITRGVKPPHGAWPYAELSNGLLFQGPPVRLWDPDEQSTIRTYPWQRIGDMGPASGDLLASCLESCGELILTDFATGDQRRIQAPGGLAFVAPEATFSPDGGALAVPVKEAGGGWRSVSTYARELALVSLDDGDTEIVRRSTVSPGYVLTAWSPDGGEVFMTGGGPQTPREIITYRLGDERARTLDVRVGDFYDIATG